jgi:F-type H+-transporting ATPase subunit b
MQEILNQLGDLVLGSVPTVIFFLLLLGAYAVLVRKPLEKVLADRHGRTGGAMDEAKAAITQAEAKTSEYENKLRAARAEIFEARAKRQKAASDARDKVLAEARTAAQHRIAVARESVERQGAEAKAQIEAGAASLSEQVLAAILPHRAAGSQMGGVRA